MKITVVYGGRGLIDDPTLYVLEKIQMVLEELRVEVVRVNLYEDKNHITTLPSLLKDSGGVILGVSLEWFGMGGYMQEFLDACWLYGDKEHIQTMYMMPVVLATTSGEMDTMLSLQKAWGLLGGLAAPGLCAYVESPVDFEMNKEYGALIEKQAENLYRCINQKVTVLPSSTTFIRTNVQKPKSIDLTPQESEQLSHFVSNDTYVKQQKEDIEELAAMFKGMLDEEEEAESVELESQSITTKPVTPAAAARAQAIPKEFTERFRKNFHPKSGFQAVYLITITDKNETIKLDVQGDTLNITPTIENDGDIVVRISSGVLNRVTMGDMTFQQAFMSGNMKMKGDLKTWRTLDQIFRFEEKHS